MQRYLWRWLCWRDGASLRGFVAFESLQVMMHIQKKSAVFNTTLRKTDEFVDGHLDAYSLCYKLRCYLYAQSLPIVTSRTLQNHEAERPR